jgi:hypothetical protein
MTNMIDTHAAAQLAHAYADAMNLTARQEYHPSTTPRKVLETYLHWSKVTGVVLHNEHWLAHAEKTVEQINKNRRAAWAQALKAANA